MPEEGKREEREEGEERGEGKRDREGRGEERKHKREDMELNVEDKTKGIIHGKMDCSGTQFIVRGISQAMAVLFNLMNSEEAGIHK